MGIEKWQGAKSPQDYLIQGHPWRVEIEPLLLGQARIIVTDGFSVEYAWMYNKATQAHEAIAEWHSRNFQDEPRGWSRAQHPYGIAFRRNPENKWGAIKSDG